MESASIIVAGGNAFKRRVEKLSRRSRGVSMQCRLTDLNRYVRGWIGYFGLAQQFDLFDKLDGCPVQAQHRAAGFGCASGTGSPG